MTQAAALTGVEVRQPARVPVRIPSARAAETRLPVSRLPAALRPLSSAPRPVEVPEPARGWLLVLDGAPGTDLGAAAGALPAGVDGLRHVPDRFEGVHLPDEDDNRARWLAQTAILRGLGGQVLMVRDWLSAVAAADALAVRDGGRLLDRRATWAEGCLAAGLLQPADTYVLLDLEPGQSLARAAGAPAGHPWRDALVVEQLRVFWLSPAAALRGYPVLAAALQRLRVERVDGRLAPSAIAAEVRTALGC